MNNTIPESLSDDIRETFYNTILCVAMENNIGANELNGLNRLQLLSNILCHTLKIIRNSSKIGFYTIKGRHITQNNVPDYCKDLYFALEQTKNIKEQEQLHRILQNIANGIMSKNLFSAIINKVINFYLEASGIITQNEQHSNNNDMADINQLNKRYIRNPNGNKLTEDIRQTFYDIMMIAIHHDKNLIPYDDVITFEPYVVTGMPGLSIIYNILYSLNTNGIKLINGNIITEESCPIHKDLFKKLLEIKQIFKNKNLNDNEIMFIKYKVVNNPDIEIPRQLENLNTPELMSIVAKIIDISLDLSRLYEFKKNMAQFLK
jgi:hypothetical protein